MVDRVRNNGGFPFEKPEGPVSPLAEIAGGCVNWLENELPLKEFDISNPEDKKLFYEFVGICVTSYLQDPGIDREEDDEAIMKGLPTELEKGFPQGQHITFEELGDYILQTIDSYASKWLKDNPVSDSVD